MEQSCPTSLAVCSWPLRPQLLSSPAAPAAGLYNICYVYAFQVPDNRRAVGLDFAVAEECGPPARSSAAR